MQVVPLAEERELLWVTGGYRKQDLPRYKVLQEAEAAMGTNGYVYKSSKVRASSCTSSCIQQADLQKQNEEPISFLM